MLSHLREAVYRANIELNDRGVVLYTWGNVSAIDRERGLVVIKPSGVPYETMTADDMVVVDLENNVVWGDKKPSSDTKTHTVLYKAFSQIGGISHTHSRHAVAWAQARREIPCLGTTQADYCAGVVPCTDPLSIEDVTRDYEGATGEAIIRRFEGLDPVAVPMVLLAGHGPFAWGKDADESVRNAVILEEIAHMATITATVSSPLKPLENYVVDYHYQRKHGKDAWYGQR
ncbi:L-ribulose-5-phosphate 4-epimerase AraD [Cohaesibacter celericrescens]|uniref:L-ribulose-5-phosphate 4-epimerase n=1 Tax=Cohaesibacter celericrescens TaxID=2067669 RepID=A0A2N5XMJ3_9HYPH|nr:L-ribulose-5-phosphate 4-epimerase AraD [Cohaesibacter celericrescens]PLW75670.1 L-ribulose-5-phosphate 4-epimerase [Cohaesibacter celericrescens]